MKYRQSAVAGQFYPSSTLLLRNQLDSCVSLPPVSPPHVKALIVPHAGYIYSGDIAGAAYAYLGHIRADIKRVILLGPSHRVPLSGCAICSYDFFNTPLGTLTVNKEFNYQLLTAGLVDIVDQAHQFEHSLEVQLPFLQYCLDDFEIVPIVVGQCPSTIISSLLKLLQADDPQTLVVVSSDLSHFHQYQQAQTLDNKTIERILHYNHGIDGQDACGCYAVNGLLDYAQHIDWQIQLIKKANSGDAHNNKQRVVGYASFILY